MAYGSIIHKVFDTNVVKISGEETFHISSSLPPQTVQFGELRNLRKSGNMEDISQN
jgi:hypothetical protein